MPTFFENVSNPAAYHILSYGTLLGTELWHSFIGGIITFKTLPRPNFAQLQSRLFPVYFAMQTALPVALALTYPGTNTKFGSAIPGSIQGVLDVENRWSVLAPLAVNALAGAANMFIFGPMTTNIMKQRKHQETRDGKKSYDAGPHSKEMQKLNRAFGRAHGLSSLANMAGVIATIVYGFTLANRFN